MPKAAELIADQLRNEIVRGHLKEGDTLPTESALMEQFGVSRPTLREAVRVLEAEGLLIISGGARSGARVQVPKHEVAARYAQMVLRLRGATLADMLQTQAVVEPPLAARLARQRTTKDVASLRAALEAADALEDEEARHAQHNFHRLVIELAGNRTGQVLMGMLHHILEEATANRAGEDGSQSLTAERRVAARSHARLVDLVEAGDADGAERLWAKHIAETAKHVLVDGDGATVMDLFD